jgi:hypothetical protein
MFAQSRPKNLREGTASGVSNIVGGAVGAVGVAVLVPTLGLGVGLKNGGIVGGVIGVTGGAVIGVVGAAALAIGGTSNESYQNPHIFSRVKLWDRILVLFMYYNRSLFTLNVKTN